MNAAESYDLLNQPWLLVRDLHGSVTEMSLLGTLRQAHRLTGLVGDVPTQVFALTRLLLAILHRALDAPLTTATWTTLWRESTLPVADIERYLDEHRSRFDLFQPATPFFQVAELRAANAEVSELNKLIADVPNGRPFFSTRLDRNLSLSPAEAARWLVHCHAFDPSGIKSGAVGDDRVKNGKGYPIGTGWCGYLGGVLPEGTTLRETLLLNLVPTTTGDRPVWERPPDGPQGLDRTPTGPVDLYTWQSRRVRLVHDGRRVTGVLICNGDRITRQNRHSIETHSAWRRSPAQEKKLRSNVPVYMPLEHEPERLIWRGLQAMLPSAAATGQGTQASARLTPSVIEWISRLVYDRAVPRDHPLRLRTIGMTYGSQSSTTAEIVDDAMSLQAILLDQGAAEIKECVLDCVRRAEDAAYAVGKLAAGLAEAAGSSGSDGQRSRATELAYAALDTRFRGWLALLGPKSDPIDSKIGWHTTVLSVISDLGERLVAEAPPPAWMGRLAGSRWISTAHAANQFCRDLRTALPMAQQWDMTPKESA